MPRVKTCTRCRLPKSTAQFNKDCTRRSGRRPNCKSCVHANYEVVRASVLKRKKADRISDPEKYRERDRNRNSSPSGRRYWISYRIKNRARRRDYNNEWRKNRYGTRPDYRLLCVLRSRLTSALKGSSGVKTLLALELLGCSLPEFRAHLETLFEPGMAWSNHGLVWHIDHIKPCAKFDLTKPAQQRICFNWKNLQPLFALDNLRKNVS